jgi:hypothetical protein
VHASLAHLIAAAAVLACAPAAAAPTQWLCWLHRDRVQAVCTVVVLRRATDAAALDALDAFHSASAAHRSAATFLRTVRERPAELAGRPVYVPLLGVPYDERSVEQLMRAVLCGPQPGCTATYRTDVARLITQAPEFFADLTDPLLDPLPSASRAGLLSMLRP